MTAWIETHDQTLIRTSAVEAVRPGTRVVRLENSHDVILMTASHTYVFATGLDSRDAAVKVARSMTAAMVSAATGTRLTLERDTLKIRTRFTD